MDHEDDAPPARVHGVRRHRPGHAPRRRGGHQCLPADGTTAYTKIEGAGPGDEVVIAPGTYAFRVYLQRQATSTQPHLSSTPRTRANPAVVDLSSAPGGLVDNAPGSYTAGDKARGCWQVSGGDELPHRRASSSRTATRSDYDSAGLRYYNGTTGLLFTNVLFKNNDNGLTGGTDGTQRRPRSSSASSTATATSPPRRPRPRTTSTSTAAPSRCGTRTCTTPCRARTCTAAP